MVARKKVALCFDSLIKQEGSVSLELSCIDCQSK